MKRRSSEPDLRRATRRAWRLFSVGYMSDWKWHKVFRVLESDRILGLGTPQPDRMTIKLVGHDEPRQVSYPPDHVCPHPFLDTVELGRIALRAVEWVEFPCDLTARLAEVGRFTTEMHDGCTRVMGYGSPVQASR